MSRRSPFVVFLSSEDRAVLEERASSRCGSHMSVVRARIVLLAADGLQNVDIAVRVGVCVDVASRWQKRFCQEGIAGLVDRPRSGRPRRFGPEVVPAISSSTVRRWLHADVIKPWRYRSWIFPRDPDFAAKAARVLDLYAHVWAGAPLGPEDYVISADEKSSFRRCAAVTHLARPVLGAWPRSSSNTSGAGPSPTWVPTTSTGPA